MSKSPTVALFVASCLVSLAAPTLSAQALLGAVEIGGKSTVTVPVTIANPGQLASIAVVTGGADAMDFTSAQGGTCKVGTSYAANAICSVHVEFAPKLSGTRMGGISLADSYGNTLATVYLRGTGVGPQTGFQPALQIPVFAKLNNVAGLSVDPSGNVYAAEEETYPGFPGAPEIPGGIFKATRGAGETFTVTDIGSSLVDPVGVAVDGDGNVLEADAFLDPAIGPMQGTMNPMPGFFHEEQSLAVDAAGNIYSAGYGSVYKSSPAFAQNQAYTTVVSGLGSIHSLAVDGQGNLYVPDSGGSPAVYKETLTESGYVQTKIGSGWVQPVGIAVDSNGVVYVSDSGTVYAETPQPNGRYLQTTVLSSNANVTHPYGLAVDGRNSLYVPVYASAGPYGPSFDVYKFDRSATPVETFATTVAGSASSDGPRTIVISNLGNSTLHFAAINYPLDFRVGKQGGDLCKSNTRLAPGESCNVVVEFAPIAEPEGNNTSEVLNERVQIVTDTLNKPDAEQFIQLSGTVTRKQTAAMPVFSKASGVYTTGQTISLSDATPGAVIYYTVNGEMPTPANGILYTGPRVVAATVTVKAAAYASGYFPSSTATASYVFTASRPVISTAGGPAKGTAVVTIAGATPGATIFYTTAGNRPTTSSTVYTRPFTVSAGTYVMAIAAKTGFTESPVVEQTVSVQ